MALIAACFALIQLASPVPSVAQVGHPVPSAPRTVLERLNGADGVVMARIGPVTEGRIEVPEARSLFGTARPPFLVKRSPLRPPPLAEGDRAILFLRGARPPYVLVDAPEEVIRIAAPTEEARWTGAIATLIAARDDPQALAATYLDWIDAGPESLRELGANAILALVGEEPTRWQPLIEERIAHLADPDAATPARRVSATIGALLPASAVRACNALAGGGPIRDAPLFEITLRGCAVSRSPAALALTNRALASDEVLVRLAAARTLPFLVPIDPGRTLALARRLAEEEPDESVRRLAERLLHDAGRHERADPAGERVTPENRGSTR